MDKPPISLSYPMFVVEYAIVDHSVHFIDRKTLSVGGEWLGEVPALAISKDVSTGDFHLCHCDSEWKDLCAVQSASTIEEIKEQAERHYLGVGEKWTQTGYSQTDAEAIFDEMREEDKCSFCSESWWDWHLPGQDRKMIVSEHAKICSDCVMRFSKELSSSGD